MLYKILKTKTNLSSRVPKNALQLKPTANGPIV